MRSGNELSSSSVLAVLERSETPPGCAVQGRHVRFEVQCRVDGRGNSKMVDLSIRCRDRLREGHLFRFSVSVWTSSQVCFM